MVPVCVVFPRKPLQVIVAISPVDPDVGDEIGKEANRLEELAAGHIKHLDEVLEQYDSRRELWEQLRSMVASLGRGEAAEAMEITKRQLRNLLNCSGVPSETSLGLVQDMVGSIP